MHWVVVTWTVELDCAAAEDITQFFQRRLRSCNFYDHNYMHMYLYMQHAHACIRWHKNCLACVREMFMESVACYIIYNLIMNRITFNFYKPSRWADLTTYKNFLATHSLFWIPGIHKATWQCIYIQCHTFSCDNVPYTKKMNKLIKLSLCACKMFTTSLMYLW